MSTVQVGHTKQMFLYIQHKIQVDLKLDQMDLQVEIHLLTLIKCLNQLLLVYLKFCGMAHDLQFSLQHFWIFAQKVSFSPSESFFDMNQNLF